MGDGDVIRLDVFGEDFLLAVGIVCDDALLAVLAGVELSVRAEHQAVGPAALFLEDRGLVIEADLVNAVVREVGEENFPLCIDGGAFGETVAFADYLPILARNQNLHHGLMRFVFGVGDDGLGIIVPEPAHRLRENGGGVLAIMSAVAPGVVDVIAGEFERGEHLLVRKEPVAAVIVEVIAPILEEHTDRLWLGFADQGWVIVAAA